MEAMTLAEIARAMGAHTDLEGVATSVVIDSRAVTPGALFVALRGENADGHNFIGKALAAGAVAALSDRPGERTIVVDEARAALLSLAERYRSALSPRVVGVTGSVGKTSTKDMIYSVLREGFNTLRTQGNLNNELGLPLTIFDITHETQAAVLEMGMSAFGELSRLTRAARPDIAVITNIGDAHMEMLGSREGILKAKLEVLEGLAADGAAVLNGDDPLLWGARERIAHTKIYVGLDNPACDYIACDIIARDGGAGFTIRGGGDEVNAFVPVVGRHHIYNALCAYAVGRRYGLSPVQCAAGIANYTSAPGRQHIFELAGLIIIDDTYNASPDSMRASLDVLRGYAESGSRYAILGSMLELGERTSELHMQVGEAAARCADFLYAYGPNARDLVAGALSAGMHPACAIPFDDKVQIARLLRDMASPGDALLIKGSRGMRMEEIIELLKRSDH